jgi:hypothetical protein
MTIRRYLLGFDKATGAVHHEWRIPSDCEPTLARVLRVDANRLAVVDPRALTSRQAVQVGAAIGQRIDSETHDYFIQAFEEAGVAAVHRHEAAE